MANKESDSNNREDESKRDKELIKIRKHFSWREIINATLLSVILSIIFVAVSVSSLHSLCESCRQFLANVAPHVLEYDFVNRTSYCVISLIIILCFLVLIVKYILKKMAPRRVIRNKDYILDLFDDRGSSSPVPTREALIKNIYGEGWDMKDGESYKSISEAIDNNVERIKEFLVSDDRNNILSLNGEWGSGKTTALLIAINETDDDNNRYIYEAAFKYTSNLDEFFNDLLSAFSDSLAECGVDVRDNASAITENLDKDLKKTLFGVIKNWGTRTTLTSDLASRINHEYEEKKHKHKRRIVVIVDDLDRMKGEDIVKILSLLSLLKNIKFVKVIVPADHDVLHKSLDKYNVVDSPKFIAKYLPYSNSLRIQTGYELAEKVLSDKIASSQKKHDISLDVRPAVAAVFIKMLSEKMYNLTRDFINIRYTWLRYPQQEIPKGQISEELSQLLLAPSIIHRVSSGKFKWNEHHNNIRDFQNIIYALIGELGSGNMEPGKNRYFTNDVYDMIDSWVFPFVKIRWEIFKFTIRDALNILDGVDYSDLPVDSVEQFVSIFNQMFPKQQLKLKLKNKKR